MKGKPNKIARIVFGPIVEYYLRSIQNELDKASDDSGEDK